MHCQITRMRERGRALEKGDILKAQSVKADISIQDRNVQTLGRTSRVAFVFLTGSTSVSPIPDLLDANVSWMSTNGFVISGLEEIDGSLHAQSWWCRVE